MLEVDLNEALQRPACPRCGRHKIRPFDVQGGGQVAFECPDRQCRWRGFAGLPSIRKTLIYPDTSTISNMAMAIVRGEAGGPWVDLRTALRKAVAADVVVCPGSSIVENEAELSPARAEAIFKLARGLSDPGLRHPYHVRDVQIQRALNRFLVGDAPVLDTGPPPEDAFYEDPHRWADRIRITFNHPPMMERAEQRRQQRTTGRSAVESIYRKYRDQMRTFEEVRELETKGHGEGIIAQGEQHLLVRLGLIPMPAGSDSFDHWWPNVFDMVMIRVAEHTGLGPIETLQKVREFFRSEHVALTPMADIYGTLHAALAMLFRGPVARHPQESDIADIDHIATFLPYVDVLIADTFFANLCNQGNVRLGDRYNCRIQSLTPDQVPEFIAYVESLIAASSQAAIRARIEKAITEGGSDEDFERRARAYLRGQGVRDDDTAPRSP